MVNEEISPQTPENVNQESSSLVNPSGDTTAEETDDQMMCRLQGGDESAFNDLVARHYDNLRNFFFIRSHTVRARQTAEDLAQEVLLRVYNESWDFIPQGKFKAWMYRIARNLLIDTIRRESYDALIHRRASGDQDDQLARLPNETSGVVEKAGFNAMGDLVAELLTELPEEQRLTFQIHHFLGLSLPEVAEVMETNTATTKSRLRLAREKLREKLQARGIQEDELEDR